MRKQVRGIVSSDCNDKTIRVVVDRRFAHPMYGKIVRGRTICHTHDERNEAKVGDVVEIIECRPRSATKRWELVRVVIQANPLQVAAIAESGDDAQQEFSAAGEQSEGEQSEGDQSPAPAGTSNEQAD